MLSRCCGCCTRRSSGHDNTIQQALLTEQREGIKEARLQALKHAADEGWADVSAGRYTDVADDRLEEFIGHLGRTTGATKA